MWNNYRTPSERWQNRLSKRQANVLRIRFSSVQLLSHVRLFATPWIAARQASLSITNSRSSLKLTSIELVMPSSHLILCCPLFLLPPIPPSTTVGKHQFFGTQPSLWSNSHICTWVLEKIIALTKWTFFNKMVSLLFNTLSRCAIAFLPRSKCL